MQLLQVQSSRPEKWEKEKSKPMWSFLWYGLFIVGEFILSWMRIMIFFPMSSISPHFWGQPHSIVWALALLALISTYVLESVLSIGGWQGHLIWWDENLISDWGLMLEMDVLDKRIGVLNPGLPFSTGYYLSVKVKECNMAFTTSHNRSGKNTIWIQCHWPICASEFTQ